MVVVVIVGPRVAVIIAVTCHVGVRGDRVHVQGGGDVAPNADVNEARPEGREERGMWSVERVSDITCEE